MMDFINASFNMVAASFIIMNTWDIWKRRAVAGHTYPSAIFFAVWAFFSIFYFWNLEQAWTFWANVAMFIANSVLLILVFKFRKPNVV